MRARKPIDPALRRFLDEQALTAPGPAPDTDTARVALTRARMLRSLTSREAIPGLPNGVEEREVAIAPHLLGRLFTPPGATTLLPVLVYMHGGGWLGGSVTTFAPFCRLLSAVAGLIILSVEYRLAPEHPYPAGLEDALAAVQWAADHAVEWGGDPMRLAIGGDSAGGNLAAVAANRLGTDPQAPKLRAQLLLYPVTDHPDAAHPSFTENATGYGLDAAGMRWFWQQYAPHTAPADPEVSPLQWAPVPPLPPTLVATAEYDVLRDEGIAYAEKLARAGVAVTHLHAPDMHHNFAASPATVARFPQSDATLAELAGWLRATLFG